MSNEDRDMSGINHRPGTRRIQPSALSPQSSHHVVVIGGGIARLSTAYALKNRLAWRVPLACTLIEARERLGG